MSGHVYSLSLITSNDDNTKFEHAPKENLLTGKRLDSTKLDYYNARYYDPLIGRLISPDTIIPNATNPHGSACGRCIKVCPWNKPEGWTHDMVRWMMQHMPFTDKLLVKMDDTWGYGKPDNRYQWWFEMEDVDGELKILEKD